MFQCWKSRGNHDPTALSAQVMVITSTYKQGNDTKMHCCRGRREHFQTLLAITHKKKVRGSLKTFPLPCREKNNSTQFLTSNGKILTKGNITKVQSRNIKMEGRSNDAASESRNTNWGSRECSEFRITIRN